MIENNLINSPKVPNITWLIIDKHFHDLQNSEGHLKRS